MDSSDRSRNFGTFGEFLRRVVLVAQTQKRCSYPYLGKKSLGRRIVVPYTSSAAVALMSSLMAERKPRRTKGRTCVQRGVA
ncbi:hypothetical protein TNCV_874281 [Trichonephila clavipes]|nr:hypothetical protein TNCV_874281 [Trichonephila clavipes]